MNQKCYCDYTPNYWEKFAHSTSMVSPVDVDVYCEELAKDVAKEYNGKVFPNGEKIRAVVRGTDIYLNGIRCGTDCICTVLARAKQEDILSRLAEKYGYDSVDQMREGYSRERNTGTGAYLLFPRHKNSLNQKRGTSAYIYDRLDLTLVCIKRYYEGADSPLSDTLKSDEEFFRQFVDFNGFIRFFRLESMLDENGEVKKWDDSGLDTRDTSRATFEGTVRILESTLAIVRERNTD